jgi:tetratricopeptide (TPR) repeat protein
MNFRIIFFSALFAVFSITGYCGKSRGITYNKYLKMSDKKKSRYIRKLVKKKGAYLHISQGKYYINTDYDPKYTMKIAVMMNDFQRRFSKVFRGSFQRKSKAKVYVVKTQDAYQTALTNYSNGQIDASWSAGMFVHIGNNSALFANGKYGDEKVQEIMFHEGTHQLLYLYIKNDIPIWFNEGMATNFETWELEKSPEYNRAEAIYKSNRPFYLLKIYPDKGFVSFRQLIKITSRQWQESTTPHNNYSSAWTAANFLLGCEDGRKLLNILIRKFRSGKDADIEPGLAIKIEKKLNEYIEKSVLPHIKYTRAIKKMYNEGENEKASKIAAKMLEDLPENLEAKFYNAWFAVEAKDKDKSHLETLLELPENDFEDPMLNYATALAYELQGDYKKAISYAKDAQKGNLKDEKAEELYNRIRKALRKG